MRPSIALATLLCAGCASVPPARPPSLHPRDYGYTRTYGRWLIENEMKRHKVTGLSVALIDDQDTIWSEGFGFANKAKEIPVDADTEFQAGSISKLFRAWPVVVPSPSSPSPLPPQHQRVPSCLRAQVWSPPAVTSTNCETHTGVASSSAESAASASWPASAPAEPHVFAS